MVKTMKKINISDFDGYRYTNGRWVYQLQDNLERKLSQDLVDEIDKAILEKLLNGKLTIGS